MNSGPLKISHRATLFTTRKTAVLRHVTIILGILLVVFAFAVPWVRIAARTAVSELLSAHIRARIESVGSQIEETLTAFETVSEFLAHVNLEENLLSSSPDQVYNLVRFAVTFVEQSGLAPAGFVVLQPDNFCHIRGNSTDLMVYYGYNEDDDLVVKRFMRMGDFVNFDYEGGETVGWFSMAEYRNGIFTANQSGTSWSNALPLFESENEYKPQMSSNTALVSETGELEVMVTVSVLSEKLFLMTHDVAAGCRFVFVNTEDEVIFDSELGVIEPIGFESLAGKNAVYPKLEKLDEETWGNAKSVLANQPDREVKVMEVNDSKFFVVRYPIEPRGRAVTHRIYMIMSFDEAETRAYRPATMIFVAAATFLMAAFFIVLVLLKHNEHRKQRKLSKQQPNLTSLFKAGSAVDDQGVLGKAIQKLRELQLLFLEDVILNKVLDAAVVNLTEQRKRHFAHEKDGAAECEFCKHLVAPKAQAVNPTPNVEPFKTWKTLSMPLFRMKDVSFDYERFSVSSHATLVRLFVTMMEEHQLIFKEIDPDAVIRFLVKFSQNCVKNPVHTAHVICAIHELISGPFKYWLNVKLEVFGLFFTAFVMDGEVDWTSFGRQFDTNEEEDQTMLYEAIGTVKRQSEALRDDLSVAERKIDLVLSLFAEFFVINSDDKVGNYFISIVRRLMLSMNNKMQFELLGEARVRIQSPFFSVQTDLDDRLLFMKALLKFCSYCGYFSPEDEMDRELSQEDEFLFNPFELDDGYFICSFHFEFCSKIVLPWLSIFTNFSPLDDMSTNLSNTIKYWEARKDNTRSRHREVDV